MLELAYEQKNNNNKGYPNPGILLMVFPLPKIFTPSLSPAPWIWLLFILQNSAVSSPPQGVLP